MTPQLFVEKWQRANLSERSAYQQHFLDLCDLLAQPKPAEADPDGTQYTFERGVTKTDGGKGWADVWKRNHFGWEYKGKHRDLVAAYQQLLKYREDLENPPLLVVCDLDRFEVHTNFTNTVKTKLRFGLAELPKPKNLDILRALFSHPESLRPGVTPASVTEQAAEKFGMLADGLRVRGVEAHAAAHFLMKLMFCMFAEDVGLLPDKLFGNLLKNTRTDPKRLSQRLEKLFEAMAHGGDFGAAEILFFNGGLFKDHEVIDLQWREIETLIEVNDRDWSNVEPSIFGTLFERTLDPGKRSQIGAHYTSRQDIETLLEPVVMQPLRREWADVKTRCDDLWAQIAARRSGPGPDTPQRGPRSATASKARKTHDRALLDLIERLAHVTILDPACGSGNFLYVAIHLLLDLEKEVITYGAHHGTNLLPHVRPTQLAGIEINPYAQQLAQVVIWIGYLQWKFQNGFTTPRDPVLEPIDSIREMDAILDLSDPEHPKEPEWPKADFIVGNPPFLGDKKLRAGLGDEYVDVLFRLYGNRIPNKSDLCCYWLEKARTKVHEGTTRRAGLIATQGVRGGTNREVVKRIKESGDIFFAVSDRDWILDGANVHVSMIGFDAGSDTEHVLDGAHVASINANLTAATDVTRARRIAQNAETSFQGPVKVGSFELTDDIGREFLTVPNPNGRPSSDVIRPWVNGISINGKQPFMWIVDFHERQMEEAAGFAAAFEYVRANVKPERDRTKRERRRRLWWIHGEVNNAFRTAVANLRRFLSTCQTSKHRILVWLPQPVLPAQTVIAFARDDDYFIGLLHSAIHEFWARATGTQLREVESGFRYTPTTCFETFPLPEPTDAQRDAIAEAARELDRLRSAWLNPSEWTREEILEFPGSVDGPWRRYVHDPDARGIGTVRYPRLVPKDAETAKQLAKRTLTSLYNERPTWLDLAHRRLDAAVFAAYQLARRFDGRSTWKNCLY